ncbi:cobyrinic acid a,c-diamide synthase [Porphyromonas uenonis 60-3]|uniref:Cobyrinate a,c-diamide synthase n=1 Tax=Porphyromonas uenonis 60-3 TaxID=596327 RepID=C2M943_9PORP|nr:cobyrinate a,c-diamide synthase [Porphyromonas uenonis]EEK17751.1 cobyrinic acid a,c-diamide synthase [Porphyromonas uenonis 60-3]
MSTLPSLLIAAPLSESGKSTLTMGLLRAYTRRGLATQAFKCGPDYVDPKLHSVATGRPAVNLDLFMYGAERVQALYDHYSQDAQAVIVEGVMGLFDGYDRDKGSAADIARLLDLPVVLVVTPRSMAYTVAPLLYGLQHFDPRVQIAGVIFNKVSSERHLTYLTQAATDAGVPVLGSLPRVDDIAIPSRYLGLDVDDLAQIDRYADQVADLLEQHLDIDRLLAISSERKERSHEAPALQKLASSTPRRIAVARDDAFNFLYQENVRQLEQWGEVTYFSPLADKELPPSDFVYLPGGYPELHLAQLSANKSMLDSLRDYIRGGGAMLAEGGGMLLLCEAIVDEKGSSYPLVGALQQTATMQQRGLALGYRQLEIEGVAVRGHEFHYSRIIDPLPTVAQQYNAWGDPVATALWHTDHCYATYTHLALTEQLLSHLL